MPEILIGLIDGPVEMTHAGLAAKNIRTVSGQTAVSCSQPSGMSCLHGTFVAGILHARRGSAAPAICPGCTLLVRPVFAEPSPDGTAGNPPSATSEELARSIVDSIRAGARIINLSVGLTQSSPKGDEALKRTLDHCAENGVIVVAAAGNQGMVGGSVITAHPWVIPVVATERSGRPTRSSNVGSSIGRRGVGAPGENVTSLRATGGFMTLSGTSVAAPFVSGAIALLWSELPSASAVRIKLAARQPNGAGRASIVPPLLDAWAARQWMAVGAGPERIR
jgi:subtilisin family serine protease